jgi:RNA polymerase sigma-70 factor (ECF subfamily)
MEGLFHAGALVERPATAIYVEMLVLRCQLGERDALDLLVRHCEPRLRFYLRRLLSDEADAEAVLQEVWLKVLRGLGRLRDPAKALPWLYALARNAAMDHLHTRYVDKDLAAAEAPEPADDADPFEPIDTAEEVYTGLARLGLAEREVLTLFFLQDLSVADIAAVLNIPPGTVKSRLFNARRALKAVLHKQGGLPHA